MDSANQTVEEIEACYRAAVEDMLVGEHLDLTERYAARFRVWIWHARQHETWAEEAVPNETRNCRFILKARKGA